MKHFMYLSTVAVLLVSVMAFVPLGSHQNLWAKDNSTSLTQKIRNAIEVDYWENNFDISVHENGNVEIQGTVRTLYDKFRIFDLIAKIPGVTHITDNLEVQTENLPNNVIRDNIVNELKLVNSIMEPDRIKVHVDNGEVILSGEVSYSREKVTAETVSSWQTGVTGITNNIRVLQPVKSRSDQNLKIILSEILKYRFPMDNQISIAIDNGKVTLTGTAYSLWDKSHIEKTFSAVQGVKKIVNQLRLNTQS